MTPQISIVVPTHDRAGLLPRTLGALARQAGGGAGAFEVILLADGCSDDTAAVVGSLGLPFALRLAEQPARGPAAARNAGAALASADLLCFLDDDMEVTPGFVAAHLDAHRRSPGGVVLGTFSSEVEEGDRDLLSSLAAQWWEGRFAEQSRPHHRFTFQDMFTGNVSMPKSLFESVGGFDERFFGKAGEDYEIGVRLLARGARLRLEPRAAALHVDRPGLDRLFRRAIAEGRGHVLLAGIHPSVLPALRLAALLHDHPADWSRNPLRRLGWWLVSSPACAGRLLAVARIAGSRGFARKLCGNVIARGYWLGVARELGSPAAVGRFVQDLAFADAGYRSADLDLALGLDRIDGLLAAAPVDCLSVRCGTAHIGTICARPASEPLRPIHVRHALADELGWGVLQCLASSGSCRSIAEALGRRREPEGARP